MLNFSVMAGQTEIVSLCVTEKFHYVQLCVVILGAILAHKRATVSDDEGETDLVGAKN